MAEVNGDLYVCWACAKELINKTDKSNFLNMIY